MDEIIDANLTINFLEDFGGDWWVLERVEHDGRTWEEVVHTPNWGTTHYFCMSRRLTPRSDIEGPADHWLDVADAIVKKRDEVYKRCAVELRPDGNWHLYSPKQGDEGIITDRAAAYLADQIYWKIDHHRCPHRSGR
jgi:hypothetical protein